MSTRVFQLAKELGVTSQDLMDRLKVMKVAVAGGHMTVLPHDVVMKLRSKTAIARPRPVATKTAKAAPKTVVAKPIAKKAARPAAAKTPSKASAKPAAAKSAAVKPAAAAPKTTAAAPKTPPAAPVAPLPATQTTARQAGRPATSSATTTAMPPKSATAPVKAAAAPAALAPPRPAPAAKPLPATPATARQAGAAPITPAPPSAPSMRQAPVVAPPKAAPPVVAKPSPTKPAPKAPAPAAAPVPKPAAAPAPVAAAPLPAPASLPSQAGVVEAPPVPAAPVQLQTLELKLPIAVKDLAVKLNTKPNDLIKRLIQRKLFVTINQTLDEGIVRPLAAELGFDIIKAATTEEAVWKDLQAVDPAKLRPRAPVVTFMGHVDHGKTSLLDAIRQTKVVEGEAGGITQHIGAYEVSLPKGKVTFLDTPGHEAFTAMRARGASATDVVVLVVAADDGVMPQTIEAIDHANEAKVPIVVAVNKMDKPGADPDRVKRQLMERGLQPEEWGGKTIMVGVSAKTRQGIDQLLEMLLLEAELLELQADPTKVAHGVVVEAKLSKGTGPTATVLVQGGTLRVGDVVLAGAHYGRIRAMISDRGHRVKEAGPAVPVEIHGLSSVPQAGDRFLVLPDEKQAKEIVEHRQEALRLTQGPQQHVTLEDLHARIAEGKLQEVKIILKGDVQGSLEALKDSLEKIEATEVKLRVIHAAIGDINESDVMLAAASDAVIIGFHVGMDPRTQVKAVEEHVDVRIYQIIYDAINAVKSAIEGLLAPEVEEIFLGRAVVKQVFKVSTVGLIAGCGVVKGKIGRQATVIRVIREKERLHEGKLASLKRFKDDVREVTEGQECGMAVEGFKDFQPGDLIEAWEQKEVARKLA